MGAITDTRAELAADLAGIDAQVFDHVPERLSPPALLVVHGSPLIDGSAETATFGTVVARFEVWVISPLGANARMTTELDNLAEATLNTLVTDGWGVENVDQPFEYKVNNASYLATRVIVTAPIQLTK